MNIKPIIYYAVPKENICIDTLMENECLKVFNGFVLGELKDDVVLLLGSNRTYMASAFDIYKVENGVHEKCVANKDEE